jgi:Carbohydrate esterase, sialic acid-specific acetylesterase
MGKFQIDPISVPKTVPIAQGFRAFILAGALWMAVSIAKVSAAEPILVFLLAGQSNMVGVTPMTGLADDLTATQSRVILFGDGQIDGSRKKRWMNNGADFGFCEGLFGPELLFGKTLSDSMPDRRIALIKYSVGGTSLASDWRPPRSGGRTGSLFRNMEATIQAGLESLDSQYAPEWGGVLWMQGEFDSGNREFAEEYEENLKNLVQDIRNMLHQEQLPFVIGMVDSSKLWDHVGTVRNAERKVSASLDHVALFDTKGFDTDGIHYKREGMVALGRNFALTYLNQFAAQSFSIAPQTTPLLPEPAHSKAETRRVVPTVLLGGLKSASYRLDGRRMPFHP